MGQIGAGLVPVAAAAAIVLGGVAHAADGTVVADGLGGAHEILEEVAIALGQGVAHVGAAIGDVIHELLGELGRTEVAPVHAGGLLVEDAGVHHGVEALEPQRAVGEAQALVEREALDVRAAHELARLRHLAVGGDSLGALELADGDVGAVLVAHRVAAAAERATVAARVAQLKLAVGVADLLVEVGILERQAGKPRAEERVGEVVLVVGLVELAACEALEVRDELKQALGVGDRNTARTLNGDGLEVLVAHDGAEGTQARDRGLVAQDGGHQALVLTGGTNGGNTGLVVGALPQLVLSGEVVQAPQVCGVADLDRAVVDVEVDGLLGLTGDDDAVIAGELELGAKAATEGGAAERSRVGVADGAHGLHDGTAAVAHGAGDGARQEGDDVLGIEGAHLGGALGPLDDGAQAAAADPLVYVVGRGRDLLDGCVGEVDLEQGTNVPVQRICHVILLE